MQCLELKLSKNFCGGAGKVSFLKLVILAG